MKRSEKSSLFKKKLAHAIALVTVCTGDVHIDGSVIAVFLLVWLIRTK